MKYIITLLSVILCLSGCNKTFHREDNPDTYNSRVIDVNNFDPPEFMADVAKELEARAKSTINKFYVLGNESVEFKLVRESIEGISNKDDFEEVHDLHGKKYFAFKSPIVDSYDIEGVLVSQSFYKGIERKDITFFFERNSWDGIYNATNKFRGEKLGLFKRNQLLIAPTIQSPVGDGAGITGVSADTFINGFILADIPSEEKRENDKIIWYEDLIKRYPDDTELTKYLAFYYLKNKVDNCEVTSEIYKKVIYARYVDRFPLLEELRKCYKLSGDYNSAIDTYKKLLSDKKFDSWEEAFIRGFLADAFYENGNKEESLNELHTALKVVESSTLDYPWLERSAQRDKIKREFNEKKEGFIEKIKAMIDIVEKSN